MAAKVTATPYHGISLSGSGMAELVLSNSAGRPRALFYQTAATLVRDRFQEMHHPWVVVSASRPCRGQACMLAVETEKDRERYRRRLLLLISVGPFSCGVHT